MTLKEYIHQYCEKHHTTISRIADHADISRSSLYNWMEGKGSPTIINLIKLATVLQVHPQYLVQLEWIRFNTLDSVVYPIEPLKEPNLWFQNHVDCSYFVSETIPDGSLVKTGERFTKTWRLQNAGNSIWEGRQLKCQNSVPLSAENEQLSLLGKYISIRTASILEVVDVPLTLPGECVDIAVDFIAPDIPAIVFSYWKMIDRSGSLCYPDSLGVYLLVHVISADSAHD